MVANPARVQLAEKINIPCARSRLRYFGIGRQVRLLRPASAHSLSILTQNLVLTHRHPLFRCLQTRLLVSTFIPSTANYCVPSLSDHAFAYRWHSPPRVRQHWASSPRGSSSNGCCLLSHRHGSSFMRLSLPKPSIGMYWWWTCVVKMYFTSVLTYTIVDVRVAKRVKLFFTQRRREKG